MTRRAIAGTLLAALALASSGAARATPQYPPSVSNQSWACHQSCDVLEEYVPSGIEFPGPATSSISRNYAAEGYDFANGEAEVSGVPHDVALALGRGAQALEEGQLVRRVRKHEVVPAVQHQHGDRGLLHGAHDPGSLLRGRAGPEAPAPEDQRGDALLEASHDLAAL